MTTTYTADVSADTPLVTTAETVVATLTGVSMQRAGQTIDLYGHVSVTTGTATTSLVLRVRRGGVTGTLIGELETDTLAAAVGSTEDHDIHETETPTGELAGATYVLTVVQTAATANGSCVHASLRADVGP